MVNLPLEVQTVLFAFTPLFSMPVWKNACMLTVGAILSIGKRAVTLALKVMGLKDEKHFTIILVDETIERRKGKKIKAKGC